MKELKDRTYGEVQEAINYALRYYLFHKNHVDDMMEREENSYPPSGSDFFNATLWKAAHWNWLFKDYPKSSIAKHFDGGRFGQQRKARVT